MELETDKVSSNPFSEFCRSFIDDHVKHWPPSEKVIADKFVRYFGLGPLPSRAQLQQLASHLGIEISIVSLPDELSGIHFWYGQAGKIIASNKEPYLLSAEQTILHELREMLEHTFRELGFATSPGTFPENRAEEFALSVRLWGLDEVLAADWQRVTEEPSWWRKAVGFAFIVMQIAYCFGCVILPLWENFQLKGREGSENRIPTPDPACH